MHHFSFSVSLIASIVHRKLHSSNGWYLESTESTRSMKLFLWVESSSIPIRIKSDDTPKTWQSFWSVDKDIPFWPHSMYPRKRVDISSFSARASRDRCACFRADLTRCPIWTFKSFFSRNPSFKNNYKIIILNIVKGI